MKATRENVEKLVEVLAEKGKGRCCIHTRGEYCICHLESRNNLVDIQLPIYLHRVLDMMQWDEGEQLSIGAMEFDILDLVNYWQTVGFSNSLQEIVEESGWEDVYVPMFNQHPPFSVKITRLKSPEARALFDYLDQLFPA